MLWDYFHFRYFVLEDNESNIEERDPALVSKIKNIFVDDILLRDLHFSMK